MEMPLARAARRDGSGRPRGRGRHRRARRGPRRAGRVTRMSLRIEHDGPLLRLTLDRAEKHNAIDSALLVGLTAAFADVGDARVVVLRGAGPSFSAGADLDEMRAGLESSRRGAAGRRRGVGAPCSTRSTAARRRSWPGVHGNVLGGACGLLACCDVVVAAPGDEVRVQRGEGRDRPGGRVAVRRRADRLRVTLARSSSPASGSTPSGRSASASIAEIATTSTPGSSVSSRRSSRAGPRPCGSRSGSRATPLEAGELAELIADLRASDEGQEGLGAFLERRPPSWRG